MSAMNTTDVKKFFVVGGYVMMPGQKPLALLWGGEAGSAEDAEREAVTKAAQDAGFPRDKEWVQSVCVQEIPHPKYAVKGQLADVLPDGALADALFSHLSSVAGPEAMQELWERSGGTGRYAGQTVLIRSGDTDSDVVHHV